MDIVDYVRLLSSNTRGAVNIGGAGAFDSIIISGIVAVLLAEIIGETRERMQGGPQSEGRPKELIRSLDGVHIEQESKPNPEPVLKRDLRLVKDDNLQQGSADMNRRLFSTIVLLAISLYLLLISRPSLP